MLTILYHKIRGFSRLHIVFKDGKVIADFAHVVVPITTWRLWNQPTMRYPSVRKQRFHRLGNEASDLPVTLAKIARMLRANAGRSIFPQNTIPSPRPACSHQQPFPQQEHATHALAYPSCNCSLYQTPCPRPGLPVVQLFPLPEHPAHASAYPSCNCSLCQTPNCRRRVVSDQRRPSQRPGRSRDYSLELPQIRACTLNAPGSSHCGIAVPHTTGGFRGDTLVRHGVLGVVPTPRPQRGTPFAPRGPGGPFPRLNTTMGHCDSLPPISPRFVSFAWRYHRCVPCSSPSAQDLAGDHPGVFNPVLLPAGAMETARSPKFP